MTANFHTPHATNAPLTSAGLNAPLGELDEEVTRLAAVLIDVTGHGAVGDDVADDTIPLQTAITLAGPGGTVVLPIGTYRITEPLTLTEDSVTLSAPGGAVIHQDTDGEGGIIITGNNCRIEGLTLQGPQFATDGGVDETAIKVAGADADNPVEGLMIRGCFIHSWGFYGIFLSHVTDFDVSDNNIYDLWYPALYGSSALRGRVCNNFIRNIIGDTGANQQPSGIGFGRLETNSFVTDPRSTDIVIDSNVIQDVSWEGIDTHGGQRLVISNNVVRACNRSGGIVCTDTDDLTNTPLGAPLDITIVGNIVTSGVSDGSAGPGITLAGALDGSTVVERATGTISGNVVRGHGLDGSGSALSAGIRVHTSLGVAVVGNTIYEPSPHGIMMERDNEGFTVSGNAITDVWSEAGASIVAAIRMGSVNNRGLISGNTLADGSKSAAAVNTMGVRTTSDAGSLPILGINYMTVAGTPLSDASNNGQMLLRATKLGFFTTTPITKPTVTGSRAGNAALASLLTQLANLGLVTDSSS